MYFIHGLFNQHLDTVTSEGGRCDAVLKEIFNDLGVAPPQLPRKENANVDLVLERTLEANLDDVSPEQLHSDTKLLLLTIIRSLPPGIRAPNVRVLIQTAKGTASSTHNEVSSFVKLFVFSYLLIFQELASNCATIEANCQKLVQLGILKEEDNYDRLRVDAFAELKNLEQQLNQVEGDLQRLSAVLKNLHEHNHFLQQQLKAYKEYLENVRKNCGSPAAAKFVNTIYLL